MAAKTAGAERRPGRRRARRPPLPRAGAAAAARRSRTPHGVEPVLPREEREVRVVVARLGGDRLPGLERDVRRVARPRRRRCRRGRRTPSTASPSRRSTPVPAARLALGVAERVGGSSSTACTSASRHLVGDGRGDRARPGAQVDHHRRRRRADRACSIAHPASSSVSGRGTKTPGPTASSTWRNAAVPVRCCSGSRAARRVEQGVVRAPLPRRRGRRPAAACRAARRARAPGGARRRARARRRRRRGAAAAASRRAWLGRTLSASRAASRAAMSASTQESRTGSRSPSSTWSRL